MSIFVEIILIYLLYRFIAGFVVPLFRASRHMRRQFNDINSRQSGFSEKPPGPEKEPAEKPKGKVGEYIDFEEVK